MPVAAAEVRGVNRDHCVRNGDHEIKKSVGVSLVMIVCGACGSAAEVRGVNSNRDRPLDDANWK